MFQEFKLESQGIVPHIDTFTVFVPSAADLVALNERADPVLADLWNNPKDAAYDKRCPPP